MHVLHRRRYKSRLVQLREGVHGRDSEQLIHACIHVSQARQAPTNWKFLARVRMLFMSTRPGGLSGCCIDEIDVNMPVASLRG